MLREIGLNDLDKKNIKVEYTTETKAYLCLVVFLLCFIVTSVIVTSDISMLALTVSLVQISVLVVLAIWHAVLDFARDPRVQTLVKVKKFLKEHPDVSFTDWLLVSDFMLVPRVGAIRRSPKTSELMQQTCKCKEELDTIPLKIELSKVLGDYNAIDNARDEQKKLEKKLLELDFQLEELFEKYGDFI